jgi:hypothetical protein
MLPVGRSNNSADNRDKYKNVSASSLSEQMEERGGSVTVHHFTELNTQSDSN